MAIVDEQNAEELCEYLDGNFATGLNNLATVYELRGRWAEAEPLYVRSIAIAEEQCGDRPNELLAYRLDNLAMLYESQGRWAEAEPLYMRSIAIAEEQCGNRPNGWLAYRLNNLAMLYELQERWVEAIPLFERVLAICDELYGDPPDASLITSLDNLARSYKSQWRREEAIPLSERALAIREHLCGDLPDESLVSSLDNLASLYQLQDRSAEATVLYERALVIQTGLCGDSLRDGKAERSREAPIERLNDLAELYEWQGQWAEAASLFERVLTIQEELCGYLPDRSLVVSLDNLARSYESQGEWADAKPLLERALAMRSEVCGDLPYDDDYLMIRLDNIESRLLLSFSYGLTHIYDRESGTVVPISCPLSAAPYTIESIDGCTCLRVTLDDLWQHEYAIDYEGYATAQREDTPDYL
jgi:tetratricopeptide (TPR) repeat protein